MDDAPITPIPPYGSATELTSSGRVSLARATVEYCLLHWGMDGDDVVAALGATDGSHSNDDSRIVGAVRLFGRLFADGLVRTFARPFGGGAPVPLPAETWELDDYRSRFLHSALSLASPWDASARPTHWIFVDEVDWRDLLERSCEDVVPAMSRRGGPTPARDGVDAEPTTLPPPECFLRLSEVVMRTGLARSTIYARMGRGQFPRQVDLDGNVAAWRETEVADWMASRR